MLSTLMASGDTFGFDS